MTGGTGMPGLLSAEEQLRRLEASLQWLAEHDRPNGMEGMLE
jgi:hypothetical protein